MNYDVGIYHVQCCKAFSLKHQCSCKALVLSLFKLGNKKMVSLRSADVAFPLIGKPIDRLSSLKLLTNLEVMQRFLYHFKCDKSSKQKSITRTCDKVVLLWEKVAEGSTPGYTCYLSVNSIKTRFNTLWEEYRQRKLGEKGVLKNNLRLPKITRKS